MFDIIMLVKNQHTLAMETYDKIYRQMGPRDRFIIADHGSSDGMSEQSIHEDDRLVYIRTKLTTNPTWFINHIMREYVRYNHFVLIGASCDVPFDYIENLKEILPEKRASVLLGRCDYYGSDQKSDKKIDPRVIKGYRGIKDVNINNIVFNKGDFLRYGGFDNRLSLRSAAQVYCERMMREDPKKIELCDDFFVVERKKPKKRKKDSGLVSAIRELDEKRYFYKNYKTGEVSNINATVIMLDKANDSQAFLVKEQIVQGDKLVLGNMTSKPGRRLNQLVKKKDRLFIIISDKSRFARNDFIDDFKIYSQYGVLVCEGDTGPYPIYLKEPESVQSICLLGKHWPTGKITEFMDWKEILRTINDEYNDRAPVFLPSVRMKRPPQKHKRKGLGGVGPGGKGVVPKQRSKVWPTPIAKLRGQSWYDWMEDD